MRTVKHEDWLAQARAKFGDDPLKWRFVCPSCTHVASVQDWKEARAPEGAIAFSCLGRFTGNAEAAAKAAFKKAGGPCNYTSGGLFCINTVEVEHEDGYIGPAFEFAEAQP